MFAPAKEPKSKLGYYRLLSPSAAVRVSPLCLGAMNFGESWKGMMGECDKKASFEILDYFYENGGNFIDTANNYQGEESEIWIGEWMKERKIRDEIVIATKFSSPYTVQKNPNGINVNYTGNSRKSLAVSVNDSLRKLQTTYIDLLYVHWWDYTTSIEELMQSLNHLVAEGKVLYLGISDTPAWVVSKANQYARDHGLAQFVVYQGQWSILDRAMERDIIPMCKAEGLALAPWGALGSGRFKTEEQLKEYEEKGEATRKFMRGGIDDSTRAVTKILEKIAKSRGSSVTGVALSYVMQKVPYVFPIVGQRKVAHLKDNIEALDKVTLTAEEIKELEDASPLDLGFPHSFLGGSDPKNNFLLAMAAKYAWVDDSKPITHAK